jgi:hypothetical protein
MMISNPELCGKQLKPHISADQSLQYTFQTVQKKGRKMAHLDFTAENSISNIVKHHTCFL